MSLAERRVRIIVFLLAIFCYSFSIITPIYDAFIYNIEFHRRADPEMINGILTASAIIFGFSTFQIGKRKLRQWIILFLIFFLQAVFIMMVGTSYFMDYVYYEYPTFQTIMYATMSLLVNLFSLFLVRLLRVLWGEEQPF